MQVEDEPKGPKWERFLSCLTRQGYFKVGVFTSVKREEKNEAGDRNHCQPSFGLLQDTKESKISTIFRLYFRVTVM